MGMYYCEKTWPTLCWSEHQRVSLDRLELSLEFSGSSVWAWISRTPVFESDWYHLYK
jgi:hypothetical protein